MTALTERQRRGTMRRLLAVAVIVPLGLGLWLGLLHFRQQMQRPPALHSATLLGQPRPLTPFTLIDQHGAPFTLDNLRDRWSFLAIGYTYCPDVCPMTLATFNEIERQIAARDGEASFVFVSVDPQRDTPDKLDQYVRYFDPRIQGVTGSEAELAGLTRQLGMLYQRVETDDTALGYVIDHSASILLIDPLGRLAAVFAPPQDATAMAQDFVSITTRAHPAP
jgi:protein SCO1/2